MLFDGYARIKGLYEIWVPYPIESLSYTSGVWLWHTLQGVIKIV